VAAGQPVAGARRDAETLGARHATRRGLIRTTPIESDAPAV
jgi:hypothetical protein